MPTAVHKPQHDAHSAQQAIRTLQTYLGRTVNLAIDHQLIAAEIIKLQTYLSTVAATNPPSNKKFDPAKINKTIDKELISAKIVELQNAANLT